MKRLLLTLVIVLLLAAGVGLHRHVAGEVDLFAVQTGSMTEVAPIGSMVVTRPGEALRVHDIVTYELHSGRLVTHRIVEVEPDGKLVTKGDSNDMADPWRVDPRQVRGTVEQIYPSLGYAWRYLTLPVGVASIVSALLTILMAWRLFFPPDEAEAGPTCA